MTRLRALIAIVVLGLVAAACGSDSGADRRLLRYGYAPGDSLTYDLSGSVVGSLRIEGPIEPGVDQADLDLDLTLGARLGYAVSEGEDPTQSVVRITQQLTSLSGSVSGMGEERQLSLADLGEMPPTTVEVVIDETGAVVSATIDGQALPLGGLGDLGGLGALGDLESLGGQFLGPQHLGPLFSDEPVGVGDDWTIDGSVAPFGLDFPQEATHRIAAEETVGARSVVRIESELTTGPIEFGLADLVGALGGQLGELGDEEFGLDPEQLAAFFEALGLQVSLDLAQSEGTATTWFDPAGGIVVRHDGTTPFDLSVSVAGIPDVGDIAADLTMTVTQSLTLVE
ncbi:MAG TPA: hypothetical protein VLD62_07090 [Acidimicrobiia bacterium]|nr:hypothetical protein [Acidimicrobiia bacterium]